ncbi:hypothetical protein K438DRAFT_1977544 [Mycena galopus ATCC 62051]|nr:hypothetical protein K438DRAFT_1977544 [Mycena galopus ATCC 62051]
MTSANEHAGPEAPAPVHPQHARLLAVPRAPQVQARTQATNTPTPRPRQKCWNRYVNLYLAAGAATFSTFPQAQLHRALPQLYATSGRAPGYLNASLSASGSSSLYPPLPPTSLDLLVFYVPFLALKLEQELLVIAVSARAGGVRCGGRAVLAMWWARDSVVHFCDGAV